MPLQFLNLHAKWSTKYEYAIHIYIYYYDNRASREKFYQKLGKMPIKSENSSILSLNQLVIIRKWPKKQFGRYYEKWSLIRKTQYRI